ncbi:MAG TPA: peptide ligase PGM1-related protein [Propionibacteriaceae bacterium]
MTQLDTDPQTTAPRLSDLNERERNNLFARVQERMPVVWNSMRLGLEDESVVVLPSVTLDRTTPGSGSMGQAFEERFLFLLLLLRQPRLRMIYVTSMPIRPSIVEYYLALLPGVIPSHAMARLTLVSVDDSSSQPLSEKLLTRPRMLAKIAAMIPNRQRCHLIPYNTTGLERDIALTLGIPMYGSDPQLADLGTKTGCRRLFAAEGVQHPLGVEDLHSFEEVTDAVVTMLQERPSMSEVIVKLNEGVSGAGNALVDLRDIADTSGSDRRSLVAQRVRSMQLELAITPMAAYEAKFEEHGGIVEERIVGEELRSPSVQLRVRPDRSIELLSTHDQLLGGASGQSYLGCIFPADPAYSRLISEPAIRIAERLAKEGALGRFAIDFVVKRDSAGDWSPYAIELNLRRGGTTHPFLTLQFLTDGSYDGASGRFLLSGGEQRHLVATDHLESEELRALAVDDLFDIVARHGLHFDQSRQTGVVFHMISSLTEHGRIGVTAVGQSPEEAMHIYEEAGQVLLTEAAAAREESRLPD